MTVTRLLPFFQTILFWLLTMLSPRNNAHGFCSWRWPSVFFLHKATAEPRNGLAGRCPQPTCSQRVGELCGSLCETPASAMGHSSELRQRCPRYFARAPPRWGRRSPGPDTLMRNPYVFHRMELIQNPRFVESQLGHCKVECLRVHDSWLTLDSTQSWIPGVGNPVTCSILQSLRLLGGLQCLLVWRTSGMSQAFSGCAALQRGPANDKIRRLCVVCMGSEKCCSKSWTTIIRYIWQTALWQRFVEISVQL